jgi:hypothetical protein
VSQPTLESACFESAFFATFVSALLFYLFYNKSKTFVSHYLLLKAFSALIQVLPELVCTIRNCEDGLREFSFWQLGSLVSIVRQV